MKLIIVDSSKAWNVTIGCFIINCLLIGFIKIYSIIIVEYQDLFDAPMSLLMISASMMISLNGLLGPLSNYLSEKFTTWKTGLFAGLLACISIITMGFASNICILIMGSAILGLSFSLIYIPTIIVPGKCHVKRQNLSQGIVMSGGPVGTLLMPLLLSELIKIYPIRGVMLILSGIMFHFSVAAVLFPTYIIAVSKNSKPLIVSIQDKKLKDNDKIIKAGKWNILVPKNSKKKKSQWPPRKFWFSVILYSLGMSFIMNGHMLLNSLYGAFAKSLTLSVQSSAYILIVHSAIDFIARLIFGYVADLKLIARWKLYCIGGTLLCITTVYTGLFPSLLTFYIFQICHAIFGGCVMVLHLLLLIDVVGLDYISTSLSIYIFLQGGLGILIYFIIGHLCDLTGRYHYAVLICGLKIGVGCLFIISERIFKRKFCNGSYKP